MYTYITVAGRREHGDVQPPPLEALHDVGDEAAGEVLRVARIRGREVHDPRKSEGRGRGRDCGCERRLHDPLYRSRTRSP